MKLEKLFFAEIKYFIRIHPFLERDQFLEMLDGITEDDFKQRILLRQTVIKRIKEIQTNCFHENLLTFPSLSLLRFWSGFLKIENECLNCGKRF